MRRPRPEPPGLPLGTAPERIAGRFVALAPGEAAPLCRFDLPVGVTGPARLRVARRQLVDRLGAEAERLELHPLGAGAWDRAVVVAPEVAAGWRADPLARDRRCLRLVPDYLALPAAQGLAVIAGDGDRLRVRLGTDDGFTAPSRLAWALLERALAPAGCRAALAVGAGSAEAASRLAATGMPVVESAGALSGLGLAVPEPTATDLDLRADPARAGDRLARELTLWSLPVALLLLALGLWSAALLGETRALRAETAQVRDATVARLREGLVPEGPILDVRAQVAQARAGRGQPDTGADPMALLRRAADPLAASGTTLGSIALDGDGLSVSLVAADFAAVERLVAALRDAGLDADASGARAAEAGVEARLAIRDGDG